MTVALSYNQVTVEVAHTLDLGRDAEVIQVLRTLFFRKSILKQLYQCSYSMLSNETINGISGNNMHFFFFSSTGYRDQHESN